MLQNKNQSIQNAQQNGADQRRQKEKEKEGMLNSIYMTKYNAANAQKKQRETNELKKKKIEDGLVEKNQQKSLKIKEQETLVLQKKKEMEAAKLLQNRINYERKMGEEQALKAQKEQEVLNMEKLEMELIKRLQHTQSLQKAAYEELESALVQAPTEFEQNFLIQADGNVQDLASANTKETPDESETPNQAQSEENTDSKE